MAFYSKIRENLSDIALGLAVSGAFIFGGVQAFSFYSKNQMTTFSEFPNEKKLSISLDDYVGMKGKTPDNYDMLQIYRCDQIVPKNTEMIVEKVKDRCVGIALVPK